MSIVIEKWNGPSFKAKSLVGIAASAVALSLTMASPASADQLSDIKDRKRLVCGTFAQFEPLGFADPQTRRTVGHDVDLCTAVARELGVGLEQRGLTVEAHIPELNLGHVDVVIANMAYTQTRATQMEFSNAYDLVREVVLVRKDSGITALGQLAGKKISATKASTSEQGVRMRLPSAVPVSFQDPASAYLALQQGKVDGFTLNAMTASKFVRQSAEAGQPVVQLSEPTILEPIGIGVKKGEASLLAEVNRVLVKLENSGELASIWNKWLGPQTAYGLTRTQTAKPISEIKFDPLP